MTNQTISQLAHKIIALRSAPSPIPVPLTYKSGAHTGAMIALFLPTNVGTHFMQSDPGALPPSELHITLAHLGKVDDLSLRQVKETHDLMRLISENHPPLTGHINGCGRFCNGDDDGDPFFIIPDLAALPNLRQVIIDGLKSNDIEAASDHGFTPHITLTYLPHAEYNPFDIIEKTPVTFGAISMVVGDDRYDYPLAQGVPLLGKAALIQKISGRKKHKLEIEATGAMFERFKRFLAMLSYNTSVGHSANFGMFGDGDGADYLKVKNLDLSQYIKELKDFQARYNSIEMAGEDGYYSLPLASRSNPTKAALIEEIGARHAHHETFQIQHIHDLTISLGAECHPLTRRAGARHSHADQAMVQRMHDDCSGLGAVCVEMAERDVVFSSQVLKEGEIEKGKKPAAKKSTTLPKDLTKLTKRQRTETINKLSEMPLKELRRRQDLNEAQTKIAFDKKNEIGLRNLQIDNDLLAAAIDKREFGPKPKKKTKAVLTTRAQSDAPNYKAASTPQRCKSCRFLLGDPGRDWCELFDFVADQDYVCDDWETQRPDEIPGYVANKGLIFRDWENSTLSQRSGRDAVNNAIKAGTLEKASTKRCFRCGKRPGAEYHHINGYSEGKKLNVRPICHHCHGLITSKAEANKADLAALTEGILILRGADNQNPQD